MEYQFKIITYTKMINSIVNIYTIYVIYLLFQAAELAYAITLITVFAALQLLTVVIRLCLKNHIESVILDMFQIGYISRILFLKSYGDQLDHVLCQMLWLTIIPQLTVHFIIYFCLGIPRNSYVSEQTQLAPLICYVLLIFLLINFVAIYNKYWGQINRNKPFLKILLSNFLKIASYYMSLCSLSFLEDSFGINLLYYQLFLMFLAFIAFQYCIILKQNEDYWSEKILPICLNFFQLEWQEIVYDGFLEDHWEIKKFDLFFFNQYLSQIVRIVLIVVFYDWQQIHDLSKAYGDLIQEVCLFCTLISSILYFFYFLSSFIRVLLTKYIIINSQLDFEKAISELNKRLYFTSIIYIINNTVGYGYNDYLLQFVDSIEISLFQNFWQGISKQLKQNKKVKNIKIRGLVLQLQDLLGEVENFPVENAVELGDVDSRFLMIRFEKGFLLNKASHYLIFSENSNTNIHFSNLISQALSITLFSKILQKYIPIMPAQVLYDLYD